MDLMQILQSISAKPFEKYGWIIPFGEIVQMCKLFGQDNHHFIEFKLKELEQQGLLSTVYSTEPGFEELLIGVKLH